VSLNTSAVKDHFIKRTHMLQFARIWVIFTLYDYNQSINQSIQSVDQKV